MRKLSVAAERDVVFDSEGRPLSSSGLRSYPRHLEVFEKHDALFLDFLIDFGPQTFRELTETFYSERDILDDPRPASDCRQWCASADWRGLVYRDEDDSRIEFGDAQPRYSVTDRGRSVYSSLREGFQGGATPGGSGS